MITVLKELVDIRADNVMVQLEGTGGNGRQYSLCSTDDTTGASVGSAGQFVIYDDTSGVNRLNIDSSGRLLIGSSQNVNNDQLQVNTSGGSNLGLSRFANNAGGPDLFLIKSRDTTFGNHTTVADNDVIGQIRFRADDGSDYVEGCRIFAKVNGSVSTNSVPTDLVFGSGTTGTERLRIGSSGQIGIGGENFGTSGQVLTSKGSGASVAWEDASSGISTQAGTASGIVTSMFLNDATDHKVTATGICTITTTQAGTEGESHTIRIVNSGIATVGFSTYFLFPSGSAPVLPTADGAVSLISFTVHDSVGAGCTQLLAGASVNFS